MNKETIGTIFAILAAVISGIAIPINKIFVVDLDPTVFTAVRSLFIGLVFLFLSFFQSRLGYVKLKKVSWKYMLLIAVVGGSFAFLLFFSGLKLTTAGRGAFLHKTLPIYATIFAFFILKEKVGRKHLYALLLMLLGALLLYTSAVSPTELWTNPTMGDIMIIGATVLWALESVIARKAMLKGDTNFVVSFSRMFFGALILLAVVMLQDKMGLLLALSGQQILNLSISICILFGYVLFWYWSIRLITVYKASCLLLIAPVVSLIFGVVLLNEPVPLLQLAGSAFILIGAFVVSRIKGSKEEII